MANVRRHLRPGTVLVIGFLSIIIIGSLLLYLPLSRKEGAGTFLDCLFVSVSSVCVTGLTTVDIANTFTVFGRVVLAVLIQLGGLGFASFALFIIALLGRNISFSSISLAKEAMNFDSGKGIIGMIFSVLRYAFCIELVGAVMLFFPYYRMTGSIIRSIGMGLFHSVSAFNNAGFDLNGDFSSLSVFHGNVYANIVVALLILLGGMGFIVMKDIIHQRKWGKFSFHTKIVLFMTFVLVSIGTLFIMAGGTSPLDAFFHAVSARTAGFSTIPMESLSNSSSLVMIFLMFIGANPGSTGGGVKTTTVFVIFIAMASVVTGKKPDAFKRRIPQDSITKALTVFVMAIIVILIATFSIMLIEGDKYSTLDVLFEVVSAAATVGLSRSLTPLLSIGSQMIIMAVMFLGRLGPLTIVTLFTKMRQEHLEHIEENVLIG
ncbi:MAG: ATPase [Sphaerochaetaceae bacterium]|nr:ATPase [Sphaerochaetaceae bacterium]